MSISPTYYVPATIACDVCGLRSSVELVYVEEAASIDRIPDEVGPPLRSHGQLPEGWRKVIVVWSRDLICCRSCADQKDAECISMENVEKNLRRRVRAKDKRLARKAMASLGKKKK